MQDAIQQTTTTHLCTFQITELPGNAWLFSQDIQIISKYSWQGWNNQAPHNHSNCAAVSSRFLYKLKEKKSPSLLFPFLYSYPTISPPH